MGTTPAGTAYRIEGSGPDLVLIHGLGMNQAMWQWQAPVLAERFRVITYDLLGHGESPAPPDPMSLGTLAEQLEELAQSLGLAHFAIAGFSLGGMIARRFALDHAERVTALAILHSAHDRTEAEREAIRVRVRQAAVEGPQATVGPALERWFSASYRASHPAIMDLIRDWLLSNDRAVYPRIYSVLAEADEELVSGLTKITCPTLVMTGAEDHGNSAEMHQRLAEALPSSRLVILPGLRHMALAEDPEAFNAPLLAHFEAALGS